METETRTRITGNLLHHAEAVFNDGKTRFVTYDMHADENLVWSLGLGCDGVIHLLLLRLDRAMSFGFLPLLEDCQDQTRCLEGDLRLILLSATMLNNSGHGAVW